MLSRADGLVNTGSGEDRLGKLIVSDSKLTVRGKYALTLPALRVLLLSRSTIGQKLKEGEIYIVARETYEKLYQVSEEQAVADFIEASSSLPDNKIFLTPDISFTGWFRECTLREDKSALEVVWNYNLAPYLEPSTECKYPRYNLNLISSLSSVLTIRLYRLLQPLTYFKDVSVFTDELAFRLGIEDFTGTSKELEELLLPAIAEINSVTTLRIRHSSGKKGVTFKLARVKKVKNEE